ELCILAHRASCSENEGKAARHIWQIMRSLGLNAELESFRSQKRITGELVTIMAGFPLAILISFKSPLVGFIIGLVSSVLFWGYFSNQFKPLAFLFRRAWSWNVVGRLKNSGARYKVVLTAHHDTARSGPLWHPRMVRNFRSNFLTGVAILVLLQLILLIKLIWGVSLFGHILMILIALYVGAQIGILLYGGFKGDLVQGASDNASGVAVMLELAAQLKERPPAHLEVWFVSTGSGEVGAVGMHHFLKEYGSELPKETTYFINFDNLGQGQLHFYVGEGMLNFYRFSDKLVSLAKEISQSKEFSSVTPAEYRLAYTDAIVPASKGYPTLLLLATNENGLIPNWHWSTDTVDQIDFKVPELAAAFARQLITRLEARLAGTT
ncbi:MAG: M28 family peptidase, partial [candidate division KSB1 bacterium]|nr:M28 family peptidase [candidate division KSB1 bacterium]